MGNNAFHYYEKQYSGEREVHTMRNRDSVTEER
jgi:hypothetical protein